MLRASSGDTPPVKRIGSWRGSGRYTTWDRQAAIASISEIADLEPSVLAGGHGLPLTGPGTAAAVHAFAERTMRSPRRIGADRGHPSRKAW
jgi:hypothetical protein